jgi:hypothetical protein
MQISAELRWFWWAQEPLEFIEWFKSTKAFEYPAGGGSERTDEYLRDPGQDELGIKVRGKEPGVEVKGLVSRLWPGVNVGCFVGPIEIWTKWVCKLLSLPPGGTVEITKTRWLRKFSTDASIKEIRLNEKEGIQDKEKDVRPVLGCNVEMTEIRLGTGETVKKGWTLGFEAFGRLETVADDLRQVAHYLADREPPPASNRQLASYPACLNEYVSGAVTGRH